MSPAKQDPQANLLPPLLDIRKVSFHVAVAVAKQAQAEGLADPMSDDAIATAMRAKMWEPVYAKYRRRPARPEQENQRPALFGISITGTIDQYLNSSNYLRRPNCIFLVSTIIRLITKC